jgi:hypothetical protein
MICFCHFNHRHIFIFCFGKDFRFRFLLDKWKKAIVETVVEMDRTVIWWIYTVICTGYLIFYTKGLTTWGELSGLSEWLDWLGRVGGCDYRSDVLACRACANLVRNVKVWIGISNNYEYIQIVFVNLSLRCYINYLHGLPAGCEQNITMIYNATK